MKRLDPRIAKLERLLAQAVRLLQEIKGSTAPPPRRRKRRQRYPLGPILDALREGALFNASPRDPRLPSAVVFRSYRKQSPKFDREAEAVLRDRGHPLKGRPWSPGRRRSSQTCAFDPNAVLAHVRGGAHVKACPPDPGMPSSYILGRERRANPEFDRDMSVAIKEGQRRRLALVRRKPPTHYDWNAVAAEIEAGASVSQKSKNRGSLPSEQAIYNRLKRDPLFNARIGPVLAARLSPRRSDLDIAEVLERIRNGAPIWRRPPAPDMPSPQLLYKMRTRDAAFAREISEAMAEAKRRKTNQVELKAAGRDAAWKAAQRAVPTSIHPDERDDIVSELSLRLCSGEVAISGDMGAAWRRCRTTLNAHRWKETSLDAPIAGTDGLSRLDMLPADALHL